MSPLSEKVPSSKEYAKVIETFYHKCNDEDFSLGKINQALSRVQWPNIDADIKRSSNVTVNYFGTCLNLKKKEDQQDLKDLLETEKQKKKLEENIPTLVALFDQGIRGLCMNALQAAFIQAEEAHDPEASPYPILKEYHIEISTSLQGAEKKAYFLAKGMITKGMQKEASQMGEFEQGFSCTFDKGKILGLEIEEPVLKTSKPVKTKSSISAFFSTFF